MGTSGLYNTITNMFTLFGIGMTILLGKIAEHFERSSLKWAALLWLVFTLGLKLILTGVLEETFLLMLIVKALLIYGWLLLLYRTRDTIFINLLILVAGGVVFFF